MRSEQEISHQVERERVRPLSPQEVAQKKLEMFPDAVFESFNELLAENFDPNDGSSRVLQKDVVARMLDKGLLRNEIYQKGYLNVEDVYSKAGWKVDYDKPGYNETYDASFTFSKPRKRANFY